MEKDNEKLKSGENVGLRPLVRLSWRREQKRWGPLTYRLHRGGDWLAIVQESRRQSGKWFWYGGGRNTCQTPTDLETAKKEAKSYILSQANSVIK